MKLVVWDTAGQEKYHALAKNYYQGASGMFVFINNISTLTHFYAIGIRCAARVRRDGRGLFLEGHELVQRIDP